MIRFERIPFRRMRSAVLRMLCITTLLLVPAAAGAQVTLGVAGYTFHYYRVERIGENHTKFIGQVEMEQGTTKIFAEEIDVFADEDRAVATGNVVFTQGSNRIAADRADFNTKTRLGTFYNAWGIATMQQKAQAPRPGQTTPPPIAGQDSNVYFYGEVIEKIGLKKYRITKGGFSACVQPTPRWMLSSTTTVLNLEHYTLLENAVLNVKGVPMLYIPWLYYPTKKEERATGFLIPTYGSSTLRGQSLHNAFFWAIDRSQDAMFAYDWFSQTGSGLGSQYRYNFGGGSDGNIRAYFLDSHESSYTQPDGSQVTTAAAQTFEIHGSANQTLPFNLRARGRVDYFSDLTTNQTFNTNIYSASANTRSYGGNVVGSGRTYTFNATYDHTEYFYDAEDSAISGAAPRINLSRNERPLFGSPVYFSLGTEYAYLLRESKSPTADVNSSVNRVDVMPQFRFPFKQWQWFTVNTSFSWRDTWYSRSLDPTTIDPVTNQPAIIDQSLNRQFFTFTAQMLGPVINRIWDTPDNGYAEKFKHSVEPYLNIQRTSQVPNYYQIIQQDATDAIVGGTTSYNYGITNRFYAKRREGGRAQAREIIDVQLDQTYYSNQLASQYDPRYATSFTGATPSNFSPFALSVRAIPTNDFNFNLRAEFDSTYKALRTIAAGGTYAWTGRLQVNLSWSKKNYIPELSGFNDPNQLDHYINSSINLHTRDNRVGGIYQFNYNILVGIMQQQQISMFYNAQCCGISFQYQSYNYSGIDVPVPIDHRFFISFTLAGLGNFSPFNGALGGVPR